VENFLDLVELAAAESPDKLNFQVLIQALLEVLQDQDLIKRIIQR
jgi:hypothetical protein